MRAAMSQARRDNPVYAVRKRTNAIMLAISSAALVFGLFWLGLGLCGFG